MPSFVDRIVRFVFTCLDVSMSRCLDKPLRKVCGLLEICEPLVRYSACVKISYGPSWFTALPRDHGASDRDFIQ